MIKRIGENDRRLPRKTINGVIDSVNKLSSSNRYGFLNLRSLLVLETGDCQSFTPYIATGDQSNLSNNQFSFLKAVPISEYTGNTPSLVVVAIESNVCSAYADKGPVYVRSSVFGGTTGKYCAIEGNSTDGYGFVRTDVDSGLRWAFVIDERDQDVILVNLERGSESGGALPFLLTYFGYHCDSGQEVVDAEASSTLTNEDKYQWSITALKADGTRDTSYFGSLVVDTKCTPSTVGIAFDPTEDNTIPDTLHPAWQDYLDDYSQYEQDYAQWEEDGHQGNMPEPPAELSLDYPSTGSGWYLGEYRGDGVVAVNGTVPMVGGALVIYDSLESPTRFYAGCLQINASKGVLDCGEHIYCVDTGTTNSDGLAIVDCVTALDPPDFYIKRAASCDECTGPVSSCLWVGNLHAIRIRQEFYDRNNVQIKDLSIDIVLNKVAGWEEPVADPGYPLDEQELVYNRNLDVTVKSWYAPSNPSSFADYPYEATYHSNKDLNDSGYGSAIVTSTYDNVLTCRSVTGTGSPPEDCGVICDGNQLIKYLLYCGGIAAWNGQSDLSTDDIISFAQWNGTLVLSQPKWGTVHNSAIYDPTGSNSHYESDDPVVDCYYSGLSLPISDNMDMMYTLEPF